MRSTLSKSITDTQLQKDVLAELAWEPSIDAANTGVSVQGGVVTLSGTIDNYSEHISAGQAARRVHGVRALANDLTVKLSGSFDRTDSDIATSVANALKWSTFVPKDAVQATVEHGHVTLAGTVDWDFQSKAAEHAVENLHGVTWVTNAITIQPKVVPEDIETRIRKAFERNARVDANKINVAVKGTTVTLVGTAHDWAEATAAAQAARSAPGVTKVEDNVLIAWE